MSAPLQHHDASSGRWLLALATSLLCACATPGDRIAEEATRAPLLSIGEALEARLECSRDNCANWHGLALSEEQRILIDVSSTTDPSVGDFAISLYDPELIVVGDHSDPGLRPRKFATRIGPGIYTLRVESLGALDTPLMYQVRVTSNKQPRPVPKSLSSPRPAREAATPRPATVRRRTRPNRMMPSRSVAERPDIPESSASGSRAPMPPGMLVRAEVIEVERSQGRPVAVIIEAGRPTGITPGQLGRLVDAGREIARIEIVDVYQGGSRAQIQGALTGDITRDSLVEVFHSGE